ncbi:MAG: tryptophan-rich sensory protein [Actinobacteria bacterium]|nr:tryptophan-rich sensory protein [Actinomycetota bacterium]
MSDRIRQVVVTASAVFMVVGTLFGIGVIGTRVEESAGGSLSATATLLAPAVRAFSIWSVIYAGLVAYVVWQWLPSQTASPRARRIGWLAAASMVLNGVWLLVTQVGQLWLSVVVIVALAVVLGLLMQRLGRPRNAGTVEKLVVDGTFGLYLGWVSVATAANITATLVASGVNPPLEIAELWAVGVLAVAAGIGVLLARVLDARLGVALAMGWGLAWIAVGRLAGEPASPLAGAAAAVAAAVVLTVTGLIWLRRVGQLVPVHVHH